MEWTIRNGRTFKEVSVKEIYKTIQHIDGFNSGQRELYRIVIEEFYKTSTEQKEIHFLTIENSFESNLLKLILNKEKVEKGKGYIN